MSRRDFPARGALAHAQSPVRRSDRRAALRVRSVVAAVALAFSTIAGVVAAIVALSPVALRRGPEGRRLTTIGRPRPVGAPDRARGTEKALPS